MQPVGSALVERGERPVAYTQAETRSLDAAGLGPAEPWEFRGKSPLYLRGPVAGG